MDIPDSYKNFEKIVSYNESERSTKIMECCICISMKKAGRRSSMKSHFHGFGGLGKPNKIYVHDILQPETSEWTPEIQLKKWRNRK